MIGRAPVQSAPLFLPPAPPPQQYVRPAPQQPYPQAQPQWNPGPAPTAALPPPVIRGKAEDEPLPAPVPLAPSSPPPSPALLQLPPPSALGVRDAALTPAAPGLDWNAVHAQLQRLGAVGFQVSRLPQGGHRVTFVLPTAQAGQTRHIVADAADEAAAVRAALARAEQAVLQR